MSGNASIQSLLGGLLKNRQLVAGMRRVMILSLWEKVVGPLVAQKSWPVKVSDGILTVGVTSHAWAAELQTLRPQILTRYRQLLGRTALKGLEFHVGRRRARPAAEEHSPAMLHPDRAERLRQPTMPGSVLAEVENPEVRDLLGPVFARLRAQREWKQEHGWSCCPTCERVYHGDTTCPACGSTPEAA